MLGLSENGLSGCCSLSQARQGVSPPCNKSEGPGREQGRGLRSSTVQRYTYMNDEVAAQVHAQTSPLSKL